MRFFPKRYLTPFFAIAALLFAIACGPSDDEGGTNPAATPTPTPPPGMELVTFNPKLLYKPSRTQAFTLSIPSDSDDNLIQAIYPPTQVGLPTVPQIRVRVAIECSDAESFAELEGLFKTRKELLDEAIYGPMEKMPYKDALKLEGKLKLIEQIAIRLQECMEENQGIKQVYFTEFDSRQTLLRTAEEQEMNRRAKTRIEEQQAARAKREAAKAPAATPKAAAPAPAH